MAAPRPAAAEPAPEPASAPAAAVGVPETGARAPEPVVEPAAVVPSTPHSPLATHSADADTEGGGWWEEHDVESSPDESGRTHAINVRTHHPERKPE
jgi:hypothetical protein